MTRACRIGIVLAAIGAVAAVVRQKASLEILLVPVILATLAWLDVWVDRQFQENLTPARRAAFHRMFARLGHGTVPAERIDRMLSGDLRRHVAGFVTLAIGLGTMAAGVL